MKIRTPYSTSPTTGEKVTQPSMTVPDQSMTISEILRRFGSGLPLGGQRVEFYEGEEDMFDGINPATLDITEKEAIIQERVNELAELQKKQKHQSKKQKEAQQLDLEEQIKKQLKAQTGTKDTDTNDILP